MKIVEIISSNIIMPFNTLSKKPSLINTSRTSRTSSQTSRTSSQTRNKKSKKRVPNIYENNESHNYENNDNPISIYENKLRNSLYEKSPVNEPINWQENPNSFIHENNNSIFGTENIGNNINKIKKKLTNKRGVLSRLMGKVGNVFRKKTKREKAENREREQEREIERELRKFEEGKTKTKKKWNFLKKNKLEKLVIPKLKISINNNLRCSDKNEKEKCIQSYNCEWRPVKWEKRTLNNIKEKEGKRQRNEKLKNNTVYGCVDLKKRHQHSPSPSQNNKKKNQPPIISPKSRLKLESSKKRSKKSKYSDFLDKKSDFNKRKKSTLGPVIFGSEPDILHIKKTNNAILQNEDDSCSKYKKIKCAVKRGCKYNKQKKKCYKKNKTIKPNILSRTQSSQKSVPFKAVSMKSYQNSNKPHTIPRTPLPINKRVNKLHLKGINHTYATGPGSRQTSTIARKQGFHKTPLNGVAWLKSIQDPNTGLWDIPLDRFRDTEMNSIKSHSTNEGHNYMEYIWRIDYYNNKLKHNLTDGDFFIVKGKFADKKKKYCQYRLYYWNNNSFYNINICKKKIDGLSIKLDIDLNNLIDISNLSNLSKPSKSSKSSKSSKQINLFENPQLKLYEQSDYKHKKQTPIISAVCGFYTVMNLLRLNLPSDTMDLMAKQIHSDYIRDRKKINSTNLRQIKKNAKELLPGFIRKNYDTTVINRTLDLFKLESHIIEHEHLKLYIEGKKKHINTHDNKENLNIISNFKLSTDPIVWNAYMPEAPSWLEPFFKHIEGLTKDEKQQFLISYIDNSFGIIINTKGKAPKWFPGSVGQHWYCIKKRFNNYYIMDSSNSDVTELSEQAFLDHIEKQIKLNSTFFLVNKLVEKNKHSPCDKYDKNQCINPIKRGIRNSNEYKTKCYWKESEFLGQKIKECKKQLGDWEKLSGKVLPLNNTNLLINMNNKIEL